MAIDKVKKDQLLTKTGTSQKFYRSLVTRDSLSYYHTVSVINLVTGKEEEVRADDLKTVPETKSYRILETCEIGTFIAETREGKLVIERSDGTVGSYTKDELVPNYPTLTVLKSGATTRFFKFEEKKIEKGELLLDDKGKVWQVTAFLEGIPAEVSTFTGRRIITEAL